MNIYEYGGADQKSLVMIHGACMSWDMFQDSIDELKEDFHIFAVAVPGHDLTRPARNLWDSKRLRKD